MYYIVELQCILSLRVCWRYAVNHRNSAK